MLCLYCAEVQSAGSNSLPCSTKLRSSLTHRLPWLLK